MDFQFWLYIIIGVIYFLTRVLKKPEQQHNDAPPTRPERRGEVTQTTTERPKQLTFEELLREITEGKQPESPVNPTPRPARVQPKAEYVDYEENFEEEAQVLEDVNYSYRERDRMNSAYEEGKSQAFNRPSLEETMKLRDTNVQFGKFKEFEQKEQRNLIDEYALNFRDSDDLKKAVIMSEILNRKF